MKLYTVCAENMKLDGGACFGVVPKSLWNKLYPADENNMIEISLRNLLAENGNKKILFDVGAGNKQEEKFRSYFYLSGDDQLISNLRSCGYSPEDITDVVLTHLHFDHGGGTHFRDSNGNIRAVFPNADIWCSKAHWEWASDPNSREKASFLRENLEPLVQSGKLKLIEGAGTFVPGIELRIMNGHTEGQLIPLISTNGKTVAFMADFIPSAAHISLPFIAAYDIRPLDSLEEKAAFLKEAADNGYILLFQHDAITECCTVQHTEKGVRIKDSGKLQDFIQG